MKSINETKLDNPVWNSLCENHAAFSIHYENAKFYHPDYCPFGAFVKQKNIPQATQNYSHLADRFFMVGDKPEIADSLQLTQELLCLQMILYSKIEQPITIEIVQLTEQHNEALCDLVNLVQPGYFKSKTPLLGDYFGIFKDDQLIAIAGERMKMNDFTEVSAIITHPDHTGKGYAKQLITHVVNNIFDQNKTPFLHVVDSNIGAIALYKKLGFVHRRKMSFWKMTKSH